MMSDPKRTAADNSPCKFADLHTKSNRELLEEVDAIMAQDAAHMDVDRLEACLELLQERAPVAQTYDPEASWQEFSSRHALIMAADEAEEGGESGTNAHNRTENTQRKTIRRRVILIAAIIVLLLGAMVTAQATGMDVFGAFARWTEETFHFTTTERAAALAPAEQTDVDFEELVAEFEALGAPRELVLTWVPSGYEVSKGPKTDDFTFYHKYEVGFSSSQEANIQFSIRRCFASASIEDISFEKNTLPVEAYSSHGRLFYIYANTDRTVYFAAWASENYIVSISGDQLSLSELKLIIDSIGEEL